jgi:succinate dehydrogenase / fumarate reductase, membrane anchor subunit
MTTQQPVRGHVESSLRSPIRRVIHLGSAKEGVGHWWSQRVSSVALIFLGLWFLGALIVNADFSHAGITQWIAKPVNAVLLVLFVLTSIYHSKLGVQVVIEDYVAHAGVKIVTMLLINFAHVLLAALGVFAVLRIAFGSAA